jgi:hypothetical protein
MQAKLDGWSAEIEALSGGTGNLSTSARSENDLQITSLKSKLAVAWNKIGQSPCIQRAD